MTKWKNPCILECLLTDKWKSRQLTKVLNDLGFEIEQLGYDWFNIVKGK